MTRSRRRKPISSQPLDLNRRRLGVVIPVMNMGGVERWAATLLRSIENVDIVGVLATSDGEFAMSMKKVAPIWNRRDASRFFDQCDDVIAWTWEDHMLDRLRDFDGRVILVSHGASTGDWSRSICRTMAGALPDADLVGVSDSASRCWNYPGQSRRPTTIYNGVEIDRCCSVLDRVAVRRRLDIPRDAKVALMLSRNAPEKRPQMFMDAMRALASEGWYGVFAGQQKLSYAPKWEAPANVRVIQAVQAPGDLFAASDVMSLHSEQESFGLALVEAWAARVPTVACRWPVINEFEELGKGPVCQVIPVSSLNPASELARAITQAHNQDPLITDRASRLAFGPLSARAFGRRWACYLHAPDPLAFAAGTTNSDEWAPYNY